MTTLSFSVAFGETWFKLKMQEWYILNVPILSIATSKCFPPTLSIKYQFHSDKITISQGTLSARNVFSVIMPRHSRSKLVPPKPELENQAFETLEESNSPEQITEPVLTELDNEIECPRCHEAMELQSSFDRFMYSCESCSFLLKCVWTNTSFVC